MKLLGSLVLVVALGACGKKKEEAPAPSPGPASAVATGSDVGSGSAPAMGSATGSAVAAGSGSAAAPVDVPTEMDYEDLANQEITDKTVDARVKALETQLSPK